MADPVRNLAALLAYEGADGWQVVSCIVGNSVLAIALVAPGEAVTAHFRNPDIEPQARQIGTQAQPLGGEPKTSIGKTAVQQDHRHATGCRFIGHAEARHRQFYGAVRAVTGFQAVDIFAQITAALGADQGDRKQVAAALHNLLHKKGRLPEEPALLESQRLRHTPVGASMLAKNVKTPRSSMTNALSLTSIASMLAPTKARERAVHTPSSLRLTFRQEEPGFQYGIRVQRNAFDALLHQPLGQVRVIRRALTANTDVLAGLIAGGNGVGQQLFDCRVTLVEQVRDDPGVTVQAQGELGQVVGTNGETVEEFEELFRQDRVGRQLAHHDDAQAVVATGQAVFGEQIHDLARFAQGTDERHHDFDVGQAHLVAHALEGATFEFEAVTERFADVTRGAAEAQHRVLFFRLVELAADQVGVFVGLEVRQTHDDLFRPERRCQGADAFDQFLDVEADRIVVAGNALVDAFLDVLRQAVVVQQRFRVHADHAVDDELQAGQAHTGVRQLCEVEGAVRVADVHHDLERQIRHGVHGVLLDIEAQFAFEDETGVAFSAGNGHALAVFQQLGGIAATDHGRDTQLAGNDGRVAGTTATVGDDGAGALHDRFPVRVGHVRYQYVAWLDLVHLGHVLDDANLAGANALANGTAFDQHGAGFLQQVTFHDVGLGAALHGFRTGLHDVQLAVVTVLGPFDVHRALVVLLDDHRLLCQLADFGIGQAETRTLSLVDIDGLDRTTGLGLVAVDHLDGLAAQVAAQDRRATGGQGAFVDVEFIRVHRALYDGFTQAVGAGDEHHVTETRLGIEGEHHAGGAGSGADHALYAGRQGYQLVVEALVHAIGNRAIVEKGGEYFLGGTNDVFDTTDVQ